MSKAKGKSKSKQASSSTEVALPSAPGTAVAVPSSLPEGIKVKRRITLPSLAIKTPGQGRALVIMDAMRVSKVKDKSEQKREPATICTVGDMQTGEMFTFIVPAVIKGNLDENYPDDSYVGKAFWIQNKGKRTESQRYNDFELSEVEAPERTTAPLE